MENLKIMRKKQREKVRHRTLNYLAKLVLSGKRSFNDISSLLSKKGKKEVIKILSNNS